MKYYLIECKECDGTYIGITNNNSLLGAVPLGMALRFADRKSAVMFYGWYRLMQIGVCAHSITEHEDVDNPDIKAN